MMATMTHSQWNFRIRRFLLFVLVELALDHEDLRESTKSILKNRVNKECLQGNLQLVIFCAVNRIRC